MAGYTGSVERNRRHAAAAAEIRPRWDGNLSAPRGPTVGGGDVGGAARPAKKNVGGKQYKKPGRALALRLVVAQVRNGAGKVLAQCLLLTNAPAWITAEQLARCCYWRWRIESFFKLLKRHGQQLEHWQQTTGPAIARRLLVAAMACVNVWQREAENSPRA